jgi:hypothetical protein
MILGLIYGMHIEQWDFITSFYFCVGAFSGSSIVVPTCAGPDPMNCQIGLWRSVFLGIFLITGVPMYTLILGKFSGLIVYQAVRANEIAKMSSPLTDDEFNFACSLTYNVNSNNNNSCNNTTSSNNKESSDSTYSPPIISQRDSRHQIDLAAFIVMELLRIKRVDMHDIAEIKVCIAINR